MQHSSFCLSWSLLLLSSLVLSFFSKKLCRDVWFFSLITADVHRRRSFLKNKTSCRLRSWVSFSLSVQYLPSLGAFLQQSRSLSGFVSAPHILSPHLRRDASFPDDLLLLLHVKPLRKINKNHVQARAVSIISSRCINSLITYLQIRLQVYGVLFPQLK